MPLSLPRRLRRRLLRLRKRLGARRPAPVASFQGLEQLEPRIMLSGTVPADVALVGSVDLDSRYDDVHTLVASPIAGQNYYAVARQHDTNHNGQADDVFIHYRGPGHSENRLGDAEWIQKKKNERTGDANAPHNWFKGSDGYPVHVTGVDDWGPYQSDHVYGQSFTSDGSPITAHYAEPYLDDNRGTMIVDLYEQLLVDLDVDSDNSGTIDEADDRIEADAALGRWIVTGGYEPLEVALSDSIQHADPSTIDVTFTYGPELRLYTQHPNQPGEPGQLLASGTAYAADDLNLSPGGRVTLLVEAVSASPSPLPIRVAADVTGYTWSGTLEDMVYVRPFELVNLTAHRTGLNLGQPIDEGTENLLDPAKYLVLTNNDYEESDSSGGYDYDNLYALPSSGLDDDLAKLTLHELPGGHYVDGTLEIRLLDGAGDVDPTSTAVRLFDVNGTLIYDNFETGDAPLTLDLLNPTGYLSGILSGDIDLYLEGIEIREDFGLALVHRDTAGYEMARDEVRMTLAEFTFTDLSGNVLQSVTPAKRQSLVVAIALGSVINTDLAQSSSAFRVHLDGIGRSLSPTLDLFSSSGVDELLDQLEVGETSSETLDPVVLYNADMRVLSPPETGLGDGERDALLAGMGVRALHNDAAVAELRTEQNDAIVDKYIRSFPANRESGVISFAGEDVQRDLTIAGSVQLPELLTQRYEKIKVDVALHGQLPAANLDGARPIDRTDFSVNVAQPGIYDVRVIVGNNGDAKPIVAAPIRMFMIEDALEPLASLRSQAFDALRVDGIVQGSPVILNRKITLEYSEFYNARRDLYKWMGAAAFASDRVGEAILAGDFDETLGALEPALTQGNLAVFMDMYPQHVAYSDGGIASINQLLAAGQIPPRVAEYWQKIENVRTGVGGVETLDEAVYDMLDHEQRFVLQPASYEGDNLLAFQRVAQRYGRELASPLAHHVEYASSFLEVLPDGEIWDPNDRMEWIDPDDPDMSGVLDAFYMWESRNESLDVRKLYDRYAAKIRPPFGGTVTLTIDKLEFHPPDPDEEE